MDKDSIRTLTRFSCSLWGDFDQAILIGEDALNSVSLLHLSEAKAIERASKMMIERAERNPPALFKLAHPFFRLAPLERFLLTALHLEKWSYLRIAQTLGMEAELIPSWAWATRIKFCFQELKADLEYPQGPAQLGPVCPHYDPSKPWAQSLLDDELPKRERIFLQNHLMACEICRKTLDLSRKMLFRIEARIPKPPLSADFDAAAERILESWLMGQEVVRPFQLNTKRSLLRFLHRPVVVSVLAAFVLFSWYWFVIR